MTPTTAAFFEKIWAIEAQNRIDFPKAHALAQQRYPDLYKRMIDASKGRATELLNARIGSNSG